MEKIEKSSITLDGKNIVITGAAGFIGSYLASRLLEISKKSIIIGFDSLTDYNPIELKKWRLEQVQKTADTIGTEQGNSWHFIQGDLVDKAKLDEVFEQYKPQIVVNLAAQAGVRYSIDHPYDYLNSNIVGFMNILEECRSMGEKLEHLVYASSSSVYGGNTKVPFSTDDKVDNPVSLYAATKKSNELLAYSYAKLYNIPSTGLRFFTVYGPAGRTDMFYFSATNKLRAGEDIQIFNYGNCKRDFTFIDDIVEGVVRVISGAPMKLYGEDGLPAAPYAIYNIGGGTPENLLDYITILQEELIRAKVLPKDYDFDSHKELVPMQQGDVVITYADSTALERDYGFKPSIGIREGLRRFAEWYKEYYGC